MSAPAGAVAGALRLPHTTTWARPPRRPTRCRATSATNSAAPGCWLACASAGACPLRCASWMWPRASTATSTAARASRPRRWVRLLELLRRLPQAAALRCGAAGLRVMHAGAWAWRTPYPQRPRLLRAPRPRSRWPPRAMHARRRHAGQGGRRRPAIHAARGRRGCGRFDLGRGPPWPVELLALADVRGRHGPAGPRRCDDPAIPGPRCGPLPRFRRLVAIAETPEAVEVAPGPCSLLIELHRAARRRDGRGLGSPHRCAGPLPRTAAPAVRR